MSRIAFVIILSSFVPVLGCAIGQHHEDLTYAAFGGVWERQDPVGGRVGSAFDPAEGPYSDGTLSDPPPLDPEEGEPMEDDRFNDNLQTSHGQAR